MVSKVSKASEASKAGVAEKAGVWRAPALVTALLVALLAIVWARLGGHISSAPSPKWGTYRPNLYFGVKRKAPTSPLLGMLWCVPLSIIQHRASYTQHQSTGTTRTPFPGGIASDTMQRRCKHASIIYHNPYPRPFYSPLTLHSTHPPA
jgi:hypothetical protein